MASSESALMHVLEHLSQTENYEPDLLVLLQCTSPLTAPEDIEGTIRALIHEDADSALAVAPFYDFLWKYDNARNAIGINHDKKQRQRRQDRDPQFIETGAVYVMRTKGFQAAKHRFFGKTAMYVMPSERCFEIDEPDDLSIAKALVLRQQKKRKLEALPNRVAAMVLDFDGVFTDNQVLVFEDGREAVVCDRGDGWGLAELRKRGLPILVLSSEENPVVQARCDKLGLLCKQGVGDKLTALEDWLQKIRIDPAQVVYLGNDVNDIGCLKAVGCGVVVANSHQEAQTVAGFALSNEGGRGAIRELTDLIVEKMKGQVNGKSC
ncbi:MAG: HAD hydrolase family protein [Proteobacteria bacterium]|nr:HAD hydrolase family protein [Pseudomonadota bacterium]